MDKSQQELIFKFQMFEQQIKQVQQQLQAVEQGIVEMSSLSLGLDDLVGAEGKEIMAPIGRGIFVKAKVLSEELTVDIGDKTFVKKSIADTKEIIGNQINKLKEAQESLERSMNEINFELNRTMMEAQQQEVPEKK